MKKFIFSFWMRRIEIKVLKLQDNKRIEYLVKLLWNEIEQSNDLVVSTGTFKQIQMYKFPKDNIIEVNVGSATNEIISINTDKY